MKVGNCQELLVVSPDAAAPERVVRFSGSFVEIGDRAVEFKTPNVLLAGGMVVTAGVISFASNLDPVECCNLLGLGLEGGRVPHDRLLKKVSRSKRIKAILVDAILMHGLCHIESTSFPNITCYEVCLEGGKYTKESLSCCITFMTS